MGLTQYLLPLCALGCVRAAQPEAQAPIAAPLRELPWGQLNFLHTTDVHGWFAGHLQEPQYGADWGDYISFSQRLREKADAEGTDLLLIDTGDRVEGNGLYDASSPRGQYTRDIVKHQHIDVITTGNHELYHVNTSYFEYHIQVPNFKDNYIASNLDYIKEDGSRVPMAQRFKKFTTKNQGIRIMAFGFIFDFHRNANNTFVQNVEDTVKEDWFQKAIRDPEVDLFVVAGHVALNQIEYKTIYETIRKQNWDTPIQFFAGHAHVRGYREFDNKAYAIASGRYLETVGFQSISGLSSSKGATAAFRPQFGRRYIDNNLYSFYHHSGLNESTFHTDLGKNVSAEITAARSALKLDETFGCSPRTLWMTRAPYPHKDSIFSWLELRVFPEKVVNPKRADAPRIIMGNTGAIRFDLFKGVFTRDTFYTISPFPGGFRYIRDVPYEQADRVLTFLNNQDKILSENESCCVDAALVAEEPHEHNQQIELKKRDQVAFKDGDEDLKTIPGYTTKDDMGDDGDDTIHSEVQFYAVPSVFESRVGTLIKDPEGKEVPVPKVDFVYLDFIEPYVLKALQFLGAEYNETDTRPYTDKDMNEYIGDWVGENWKCD